MTSRLSPPGVQSPDVSADSIGDDNFEETTFTFSCAAMCQNLFMPWYQSCQCAYHVLRSLPANSFIALALVIVGFVVLRGNVVSEEQLQNRPNDPPTLRQQTDEPIHHSCTRCS